MRNTIVDNERRKDKRNFYDSEKSKGVVMKERSWDYSKWEDDLFFFLENAREEEHRG